MKVESSEMFDQKKNFFQLNLFSGDDHEENQFDKLYEPEKYIITNSNLLVASYLCNLENWKTDKICLLHGPKGSGKTHLCSISNKKNPNSILINRQNLQIISNYEILDQKNFVILDDLDHFSEEVIFHFFNYIRFSEKFLLLSSRDEFLQNIKLKDLGSRLFSVPNFHLNQIDENLLRGIVIKILSDYDIVLSPPQLKFLCFNLERSFESIFDFTTKIQKHVSQNSGKISLSVLKKIVLE
jgi:chromosomal replication initiation ATPase DnaA